MDATRALNLFSAFLLDDKRNANKPHRSNEFLYISNHVFGSFKTYYPEIYKTILDECSDNYDKISTTNIQSILVDLFAKYDTTRVTNFSLTILNLLINDYFDFNSEPINEDQLSILTALKTKFEDQAKGVDLSINDAILATPTDTQTANLLTSMNLASSYIVKDTQPAVNNNSNISQLNDIQRFFNTKFDSLELKLKSFENNVVKDIDERLSKFEFKKNTEDTVNNCEFIIEKNYTKFLRSENNIKIMKSHKDNKTAPKAMDFKYFPDPWLKHEPDYVKGYNDLIKKFQIQLMDYIITYLESKKLVFNTEIETQKDTLTLNTKDVDKKLKEIKTKCDKKLEKEYKISDQKCQSVILTEYVAIPRKNKDVNKQQKKPRQSRTNSKPPTDTSFESENSFIPVRERSNHRVSWSPKNFEKSDRVDNRTRFRHRDRSTSSTRTNRTNRTNRPRQNHINRNEVQQQSYIRNRDTSNTRSRNSNSIDRNFPKPRKPNLKR